MNRGNKMEKIKTQITDYWTRRVESFSKLRIKELFGEKHNLWLKEFEKYIPMDHSLNILDVGTGTGFFAFLLTSKGHKVTGIDLTEDMIKEANRLSDELNIPSNFIVMDAENPKFAPKSFDAIVTRNLTWGLPHLSETYKKWHSLLKPNGILVNFDADYCHEKELETLPPVHAHKDISQSLMQEYENIKAMLRPTQNLRPRWDAELLKSAGFHDISVDTDVWERIYGNKDEFYNPTPIFTITARA